MTINIHQKDRIDAIEAARAWVESNAIVLDTETTGLGWGDEVIEVAAIRLKTGDVLLNTLIQPSCDIPAEATAIHGITTEKAMTEGIPAAEALLRLVDICVDRTAIAYNAAFDIRLLRGTLAKREYRRIAARLFRDLSTWNCAMLTYAAFKGDWNYDRGDYRWHKLSNAAAHQGIEVPTDIHRALADAQLTRQLILSIANTEVEA